ncbi:MAG: methyltransferase domain-containing protein [Acidimicrobiia bacterium]
MAPDPDRYSHGHHESVLRSHRWRTAENSAAFLLPHLRPGDSVLDVGCGPGTISLDLARLVFPGRVTGIDLAEEVVEAARRDCAGAGGTDLAFAVGDVYSLDFDDAAFDVVYAHQVLQHLSDPVAALREMRRVLRSPGLLAVRDSDYGAFVWTPPDPRLDRWMEIYHRITAANHADADAGRHLHQWVREAGYTDAAVSSSNWTFQTADARGWWGGLWADRVRTSEYARQGVEYRLTTTDELDEIAAAFREWAADEDGLFIVVHGEVLARV